MNKKYIPIVISVIYDLVFFTLTYLSFSDNRPSDGPLSLGFPVPFYFGGGRCAVACGPDILPTGLVIDVLVFALPIAAYLLFVYFKKNKVSAT